MDAATLLSPAIAVVRAFSGTLASDALESASALGMLPSIANLMRCADRSRASFFKYQETNWLSADRPSAIAFAPWRLYMLSARYSTKTSAPTTNPSSTYQKRESSIRSPIGLVALVGLL